MADKPKLDAEITALFQQWLTSFEKTQSETGDEEKVAALALSRIESQIAATPAEGLRGLVVKLGLHFFLNEMQMQEVNKLIPPTLIWYV